MESKPEVVTSDLLKIDPPLGIVLNYAYMYARQHGLPFLLTSITTDGENIQRVSNTHKERRAADVSTRGWSVLHCNRLTHHLNRMFGIMWGTRRVGSTKAPTVCVYGDDNHLDHFHFQVRRSVEQLFG